MDPVLTVYHDGSCPLCRMEIGHYRRQRDAERIEFVDVSDPSIDPGLDLPRKKAMGRFHVRLPNGELRSGGAAFVEICNVLPSYRPAAWLARFPGITPALDVGYELASPPLAARFVKHIASPSSRRRRAGVACLAGYGLCRQGQNGLALGYRARCRRCYPALALSAFMTLGFDAHGTLGAAGLMVPAARRRRAYVLSSVDDFLRARRLHGHLGVSRWTGAESRRRS